MKYSILFTLAMVTSLSAISYEDVKVSKDITVHLPEGWLQQDTTKLQYELNSANARNTAKPYILLYARNHNRKSLEALVITVIKRKKYIKEKHEQDFRIMQRNYTKEVESRLEHHDYTITSKSATEETIGNIKSNAITILAEGSNEFTKTKLLFMVVDSNIYYVNHTIFSRDSNIVNRLRPTTELFSINQPFTTSRLEFGAWSFKEYEGGIMMYSLTNDEKQRITFNCMPNKRKVFAYREKKSPAYSQADYKKAYDSLDSINVMGWDIEYVDGFVQDENYAYILLPLPKDFVPKSDSNGRIIIKGKDHALELQTEYELLKDSLEVTFDNCLEGVP